MEANRLYPTNNSRSNGESAKFIINCQARVNSSPTKDTRDWLELTKMFAHDSPTYRIYEALIEHKKHIVAKIGTSVLEKEMQIGTTLETLHLPTFLIPHCAFSCLDTIADMNQHTRYVCKEKGSKVHVLLMPFIDQGSIGKYKWDRSNFHILQNLMKHITASLLVAALGVSVIHNDFHPGNILVKRTTRKSISYGIYGTIECLGFMPVIMDYDKSIIIEPGNALKVYNDLGRFFRNITDHDSIVFDTQNVTRMIEIMVKRALLTPEACNAISKEIDALSIIRLKSEIPKLDMSQFKSLLI
jgi:hypothetical protein